MQFSSLTVAQLKNAAWIERPDLSDGLIQDSTTEQISGVLNPYHSEVDVRCAFCRGHTKHRRGLLVSLRSGRNALIGVDCASLHFGAEVSAIYETTHSQRVKEQYRERRRIAVVEGIDALCSRVRSSPWREAQDQFLQVVDTLSEVTGWADAPRRLADDGSYDVLDDQGALLGRIRGANALTGLRADQGIERVVHDLVLLQSELQDCKDRPRDVERALNSVEDLLGRMSRSCRFNAACRQLFTPASIAAAEHLVQQSGGVGLELKRSGSELRLIHTFLNEKRKPRPHRELLPDFANLPKQDELLGDVWPGRGLVLD